MANTLRRWAAISCVHAPFYNEESFDNLLGRLEEGGPYGKLTDFILLGDLFESSAASVHPNETEHTLAEEYEMGAHYLEEVRARLPKKCRLHWLLGNHDDNLQFKDSRRTEKSTRDLIHWMQSRWEPEFRLWKQRPYIKPSRHSQKGCLQIGQCIFVHGWDCGVNSDETECIQVINATGGHAHRLVVRGHTHRPVDVTQCKKSIKIKLPFWYANAGTMGPVQPDYMARKDCHHWGASIVWGECKPGTPGRFSGVEWSAETELL
jgi:hypothetical protein